MAEEVGLIASPSRVDSTFLGALGVADRVRVLLKQHANSAGRTVTALGKDPEFRLAIADTDGRRKLFVRDIHEFMTAEALDREAEVSRKVSERRLAIMEKNQVGKTHGPAQLAEEDRLWLKEATLQARSIARSWFPLAERAQRILDDEMEDYEAQKQEPVRTNPETGEPYYPQFPIGLLDTTRKSVLTSLEIARAILDDPAVMQIVNAEQLVVNQGLSQDEFHAALFGTCKKLGISQTKALEAYSLYMSDKLGTNIIDAVPLPPIPEWREAEKREVEARRAAEAITVEALVADPPISDGSG